MISRADAYAQSLKRRAEIQEEKAKEAENQIKELVSKLWGAVSAAIKKGEFTAHADCKTHPRILEEIKKRFYEFDVWWGEDAECQTTTTITISWKEHG